MDDRYAYCRQSAMTSGPDGLKRETDGHQAWSGIYKELGRTLGHEQKPKPAANPSTVRTCKFS
eukprot:738223-Amphidinium_carterae.1